ncbi:hypothetical protein AADZ90_019685 [Aestuariibius sp. 2305UL40-4]|uniref:hypothetical protein n=1 Tax=Aestuariibius violaceus TaxID=3234132 RepID=UPI00345E12B1
MDLEKFKSDLERDQNGILDLLGCSILKDHSAVEILSHSHLTEEQRRDEDLMAHVQALERTNALCTFVFEYAGGELLGFWHGPDEVNSDEADIIVHDTEGQYEATYADNLAEALCYWHLYNSEDEEEFSWLVDAFARLGVFVRPLSWEEVNTAFMKPRAFKIGIDPNDYRDQAYEKLT